MNFIAIAIQKNDEDKIELTLTMDEAKRLAEKWSRDLNCTAYVGMVMGKFVPTSSWVGAVLGTSSPTIETAPQ